MILGGKYIPEDEETPLMRAIPEPLRPIVHICKFELPKDEPTPKQEQNDTK